jgi:hypothetical protein
MQATTARELLEALRSEDERRSLAALSVIDADPTDDAISHDELLAYFDAQVARLSEVERAASALDTSRELARRRHICHQALDVISKAGVDLDVLSRCRAALGTTHASESARLSHLSHDGPLARLEPHAPFVNRNAARIAS